MNELAIVRQQRALMPAQADAAAISRASSHGVAVSVETSLRFPKGGGAYAALDGVTVRADDEGQVRLALAEFRALMAPAPTEEIENWLAALDAACARRATDDFSAEVKLTVLTADLARFPADVVRQACDDWRTRRVSGPNWFPTNAELVGACERLAAPRAAIVGQLEAWRPRTAAQRLEDEAAAWSQRGYAAAETALRLRRTDPAGAREAEAQQRAALREAKRLRIEAREARGHG